MIGSAANRAHFDLSDSKRVDLKDNTNTNVLGQFKDETSSLIMTERLALNPEVYAIDHQTLDQQVMNKTTLDRVSKVIVKNEITQLLPSIGMVG